MKVWLQNGNNICRLGYLGARTIGRRAKILNRDLSVETSPRPNLPRIRVPVPPPGASSIDMVTEEPIPPFARMLTFNTGLISLGGHRGMGANQWETTGPKAGSQWRENTCASFLEAIRCGATFIEFDVQVTSDGVPVIFHDDYAVYGHASAPTSSLIKHLSCADFKALAPSNSSMSMSSSSATSDDDLFVINAPFGSSSSLAGSSPLGGSPMGSPRFGGNQLGKLLRKHQNDRPAIPCEPSLHPWEVHQEDDLPTLAEVFSSIPHHVGFDIEIKMTTPADQEKTPPEEVDRIVTATLQAIDAAIATSTVNGIYPSGVVEPRALMFSSFDPEVCLELKLRRPEYSVMFLTGGGVYPHVDGRRTSLKGAIDFACGAGLDGIIVETLALKEQQNMVSLALERGLHVMTYGTHNDDVEWVLKQEELGVHGVIVDDVKGVSEQLQSLRETVLWA